MRRGSDTRSAISKLFPFGGGGDRETTTTTLTEMLLKGIVNAFVLALSFTVFLVFVLGSYDFFKNVEDNKCQMTYMFEYPEYIPIKLDNEMDKKYPMYGLYVYGEGRYAQSLVKQKFTGIPVLYIPGNSGSYKQVRSFASVALRIWLDSKSPYHFDFFSLDFNEELSGLYGYVLNPQSEYTQAAIEKIQSLYEDYHSVVLIGHSMGGIVAKYIKPDLQPMSNLIFTLSSPHIRPALIFDPEQDIYYYHMSRNWTLKNKVDGEGKDVTLVSVGGGDRDHLVAEGTTKWGANVAVYTTTTAVPGVWASTDHLCIVWCKQFVMTVVRSLFDLVEYREQNGYYAIEQDPEFRKKILDYHFLQKSSGKSYHGAHPSLEIVKPPVANWNELLVHKYCAPPSKTPTYLMFPMQVIHEKVKGRGDDYRIVVLTTNTEPKNWVFGCTSQSFMENVRYCSVGENLSHLGKIIPHIRRRRKAIHLKFSDIAKYSHLIVKMDGSNLKSCVNLEVYDEVERSKQLLVKFDTEGKMFYNMSLPVDTGMFAKLFAWRISAYGRDHENKSCEGAHNSLGIFEHGHFSVNRFLKNESLIARFSDWNATSGNVELYLDPSCKYTISVRLASLETAGQIFRTYFRLLPSFFASIILMSLYFQKSPTDWINFHRVILSNAYYLTIVPGFVVSLLLTFIPNDWPSMLDGPEYSVIVPMFCYLVAYVFVLITASAGWYLIIACGNVVHTVFMKFVTSRLGRWFNFRVPMPDQITDFAFDLTFGKFPVIIAVFLVSLTLATCGALGLAAGLVLFITKLCKMYQDLLDDLWRAKIQDVAEGLSPLNFQFSCAMIWFSFTALNVPSLVHWVKNVAYYNGPQWDLSMYLCLMVIPTISILWQNYVPNFHPMLWLVHRYVFYIMGLCLIVWGTFRLYLIGFILTFVLITTSMCQLISSLATVEGAEEEVPPNSTTTGSNEGQNNQQESEVEEEVQTESTDDDDDSSIPELRPHYTDELLNLKKKVHFNVDEDGNETEETEADSETDFEIEDSKEEEKGGEVAEGKSEKGTKGNLNAAGGDGDTGNNPSGGGLEELDKENVNLSDTADFNELKLFKGKTFADDTS